MRKNSFLLFLGIVAIAVVLRFFRIQENLVFHGELGHNYLAIKNMIAADEVPLLGPPTSHPWLSFGPAFYWIFAPVLTYFNYSPLAGGYFFAGIGVLTIFINYLVIGKLLGRSVGIVSSFLLAISPAWVSLAREARFFSLTTLFFYPFLYFFVKGVKNRGRGFFWAGIFFGMMLNFHLTPLILILPVSIIIFINRRYVARQKIINALVGIVIPTIPFLLYNLTHRMEMLARLVLWIPYRVLGFLGLYPKNTISEGVLQANIGSLYNFFTSSFFVTPNIITAIFITFLLLFIIVRKKRNLAEWTLLLFLVFGYLGIFLHGDPPFHYYLPLYPIPIIFAAIFFERFWTTSYWGRVLAGIFISYIILSNSLFFFSRKWFFIPQDKIVDGRVPYRMQLEAADEIIKDANGASFTLHRTGPDDNFEGDFAQNYQYLLWWKGNEPVVNSGLTYTIREDEQGGKLEVIKNEGKAE